jgi:AcrR family transcriptional regulator
MQARAAAAEATRGRIAQAALDLFATEWYDDVSLRQIALAAGVSLQTVVNHFGSKEGVLRAAADRFEAAVLELRADTRPDDPASAAEVVVGDYERTGELSLRALALSERSPAVAQALAQGRRAHYEWVESAFPGALAEHRGAARRRRLAQLATVTDVTAWSRLRHAGGLSRAQTTLAMCELIESLYDHPPRRSSP